VGVGIRAGLKTIIKAETEAAWESCETELMKAGIYTLQMRFIQPDCSH
jgi:hypothetical protein